jgi:hypothetical protein
MSDVAIELASQCLMAWVGGFAFGFTLKTIKVFFEKI